MRAPQPSAASSRAAQTAQGREAHVEETLLRLSGRTPIARGTVLIAGANLPLHLRCAGLSQDS